MFSSGPNYSKLKTNLRLCINRLKLLEKKKTELALKNRKEIADYISMGKPERAKIRVEHIIREDYVVEAMELLEMFCDLLLARFGLIQQMKTLDDGLAEAISSIIWVAPRLQSDVQELKIVSDQLSAKYGKPYALACRENAVGTVSEKLMHKLSVQAPPKVTVEKYLIEIAKYYNVEYEPDPQILSQDEVYAAEALIELAPAPALPEKNDLNGPGAPSAGLPPPSGAAGGSSGQGYAPFNYPAPSGGAPAIPPYVPQPGSGASSNPPGGFAYPPNEAKKGGAHGFDDQGPPPAYNYFPPDLNSPSASAPGPAAAGNNLGGVDPAASAPAANITRTLSVEDNTAKSSKEEKTLDLPELPELPGVPMDTPTHGHTPGDDDDEKKELNDEEIDFDDLTRRFEALKKKK